MKTEIRFANILRWKLGSALLLSTFCFLLSAFPQGNYKLTTAITNQSILAQNNTNAVSTNIVVSGTPVVLSAQQLGKLAWFSTLKDGVANTNLYWTVLFSPNEQVAGATWLAPQFVTNTFAGPGVTSNNLQIITVPDQTRWLLITNAAHAQTNNGTATVRIGQFW
jgi:hypothetical protein